MKIVYELIEEGPDPHNCEEEPEESDLNDSSDGLKTSARSLRYCIVVINNKYLVCQK